MLEDLALDNTSRFLPFVIEIRKRLLFVVSLFLIAGIIGFIYYEKIVSFVLSIFEFKGVNLVFTSPFQFIGLAINSSLLVGFVVVFPVLMFQLLAFLKPALKPKEFRVLLILLPVSLVLFLIGFTYGILIMRYTVELFYVQTTGLGVGNFLDISQFLSQTLLTSTLLGVAFQFPIILALLLRFKVISHKFLSKQRAIIYFIALIFVVLLPLNDLLSDALLLLPLVFLFELTLILNRFVFKSK